MLSGYAKREWLTILAIGLMVTATSVAVGWYALAAVMIVVTAALLSFFRDPERRAPMDRAVMVSPSDGRVSSIHTVDHFAPFDGPALCVRVFLSVLDVHVIRCPCHGKTTSVTHRPGKHLNALNPDSAEVNESTLAVFEHPTRNHPVAAVRQVAGLIARTIVCGAKVGDIFQRGQRTGIIKFGSTAELYVPAKLNPQVAVEQGARVVGGVTILARYTPTPSETRPQQERPQPLPDEPTDSLSATQSKHPLEQPA